MLKAAVLTLLLAVIYTATAQRILGTYNVDRSKISTSGTSSGACMATQLHVAYSALIMGVGLVAGTPYYCAQGSAVIATGECSSDPSTVEVSDFTSQTNYYANQGLIDPTSNLQNSRVFILAGNQDTVVVPGIGNKVQEYYNNYATPSNVRLVNIASEHTFPTMNYGNACSFKGSPYIGRCNYDGAYEILNWMYPGLTRPSGTVPLTGDFYEFDQSEFFYVSPPSYSSMDTSGYVYVPSGCVSGANVCRLHVSFHGCQQGKHLLGDEYARNTGYNEVGELNNIIILYPQAIAVGVNPYGCWDWWGYTIADYATQGANQPLAVFRMIDRLL